MKKYLGIFLVVGLIALMLPRVALAVWWNPLTWFDNWSFLRGKDAETEILENRVAELEKKLEEKVSPSPSTTLENQEINQTPSSIPTPPKAPISSHNITPTSLPTVTLSSPKTIIPDVKMTPSPAPSSAIDKYGMSASDWAVEDSSLPQMRDRIQENKKYITEVRSYIGVLDDGIVGALNAISSNGFLDDSGIVLAKEFIEVSQRLKNSYGNEIHYIDSENDYINEAINALSIRNRDLLEQNLNTASVVHQKAVDAIYESASLLSKHKQISDAYFYHITGHY